MRIRLVLLVVGVLLCSGIKAQFLMDMLDTTKEAGRGMLGVYRKFDHLRIGGYIQPQFQVIQSKGAKTFDGGDFSPSVNNRFMLRRSRVRIDYVRNNNVGIPGVQIVFQFDANERGFTVRDIWGRIFENKYQLFSFTMGMFARPFGYEVNLSSSDRETPERGRMSQTLMKSERDLGAMVSLDVRKELHPLKNIKMDIGVFNGQGISANGDFDNRKDIIGRISLKPVPLAKGVNLSGGASMLHGGLLQNTRYVYYTEEIAGLKKRVLDSSLTNLGSYAPRKYFGADAQLKINNTTGFTELRGEVIAGKQSGTDITSETPLFLMTGSNGFHERSFNGAYIYFIQHLNSLEHQLVLKYDWYDPNTKVKGLEIGAPGTGLSAADVRYNTLNIGYLYHPSDLAKVFLFYSIVKNESTQLPGFTQDIADNALTLRVQFRF